MRISKGKLFRCHRKQFAHPAFNDCTYRRAVFERIVILFYTQNLQIQLSCSTSYCSEVSEFLIRLLSCSMIVSIASRIKLYGF
jgi:hypothetical protein